MTAHRKGILDSTRLMGALLAAHFVFVCIVKASHGTPWQLLWFCHISLALAAVGFLTRSTLLKATALTNILVLHSLWIVDFAFGYSTGVFPIAFSSYFTEIDPCSKLASLHHLYLLPVLLWSFVREREYRYEAWLMSATLFVLVMLASRSLLSPAQNVNYAYFVPESLRVHGVSALNQLPDHVYLFALHGAVNLVAFLPAAIALATIARLSNRGLDNSHQASATSYA